MSLFPVIVIFGLSFPPIFFELLFVAGYLFGWCDRLLVPTGIYDFVWHPALFNTALLLLPFFI